MKLYYFPGACSLAVHITLNEAGLKFDTERVDLQAKKTASGADFNAINPRGYVPALTLDNGQTLTEASAILQYLADQAPAKQLAPAAGTFERTKLQEWIGFISTELHKGLSPLFNPQLPKEAHPVLLSRVERWNEMLDAHLAKNSYLMGNNFTVADAYAFTVLNWNNFLKISLEKWPNVRAYMARIAARPSAQAAMKTEGLL